MAIDRETLFSEVWAEPMTKVAVRYGVSSSFLARVCERLNVPRPPRGYWAQLAVGKAPAIPPLPYAQPGDALEWTRGSEPTRPRRALPQPPAHRPSVRQRPKRKVAREHPLLMGAREHFDGPRESENGYLRPTKRRLVDLLVSRATLDRALAVAKSLFTSLEHRGHRVILAPHDQQLGRPDVDERGRGGREQYGSRRWRPDRPTVVYVGTVAIGLTIFEISEETEVQYVDGKYIRVSQAPATRRRFRSSFDVWTTKRDIPNGRLCLRATSPYPMARWERLWREERKGELAPQIPDIVLELESAAVTVAELVEEGELRAQEERRKWALQQEQWRREEEERRRARNLKDSREQLASIIEEWVAARQIDEFLRDAEREAATLGNAERTMLLDRLRRARDLLGGVDALQHFLRWKAPEER